MGFRKSEMRVTAGDPIAAVRCHDCDYVNGVPPDAKFASGEAIWGGGCGRTLGTWEDAVFELYGPANDLLARTLANRPKG